MSITNEWYHLQVIKQKSVITFFKEEKAPTIINLKSNSQKVIFAKQLVDITNGNKNTKKYITKSEISIVYNVYSLYITITLLKKINICFLIYTCNIQFFINPYIWINYATGDEVTCSSCSSKESVYFSCDETDEGRTGRLKLSLKSSQFID